MLRITIFTNNETETLANRDIKKLRKELQSVRDSVNKILDRLQVSHKKTQPSGAQKAEEVVEEESSEEESIVESSGQKRTAEGNEAREFDPLGQSQRSQSSQPQDDQVSTTGSVRSVPSVPVEQNYQNYPQSYQQPSQKPEAPVSTHAQQVQSGVGQQVIIIPFSNCKFYLFFL